MINRREFGVEATIQTGSHAQVRKRLGGQLEQDQIQGIIYSDAVAVTSCPTREHDLD